MKIFEVMQGVLDVEDANDMEVTLVDPKTDRIFTLYKRSFNKLISTQFQLYLVIY